MMLDSSPSAVEAAAAAVASSSVTAAATKADGVTARLMLLQALHGRRCCGIVNVNLFGWCGGCFRLAKKTRCRSSYQPAVWHLQHFGSPRGALRR